jgi:hypothetical protein
MKRLAKIPFTAALFAGVALAQSSTSLSEQWFRTKFGHPSPAEQARLKAEAANTAYRDATPADSNPSTITDAWFRTKFGRFSPAEEARRKADAANTAFRDDGSGSKPDPDRWIRDFYKQKYGREMPNRK